MSSDFFVASIDLVKTGAQMDAFERFVLPRDVHTSLNCECCGTKESGEAGGESARAGGKGREGGGAEAQSERDAEQRQCDGRRPRSSGGKRRTRTRRTFLSAMLTFFETRATT